MGRLHYSFWCIIFVTFCVIIETVLPANDHIVEIPNQGKINGIELSKFRIQKIIAYYGIPYAKPPIDELRFAPPDTSQLPQWNDTKNNTDYQLSCLQHSSDFKESERAFFQLLSDEQFPYNIGEDCLYLNIFVPNAPPPPEGYATIIWIHPGNFTTGMPSIWNPHTFVYRQRVIVVTFAYRLNIMGFFTTGDEEAPGNYALMDQQAAILWTKNNIHLFGGNANNICLMGSGTGAISVAIHIVNQESRNLFHKAILMSGNIENPSVIGNHEQDRKLLDKLVTEFGCVKHPTYLILECLRRADGNQLVKKSLDINWRPTLNINSTMPFLQAELKDSFLQQDYANISILTGYTNMEQALELDYLDNITDFSADTFRNLIMNLIYDDIPRANATTSSPSSSGLCLFNHLIDSVIFFYEPPIQKYDADLFRKTAVNLLLEKTYASSTIFLATKLSEVNRNVFVYRFDLKPSTKKAIEHLSDWVTGVPHLYDLLYVWGVPYWGHKWDYRDKQMSETIMTFWSNFAKYSHPIPNDQIYPVKWEPYRDDAPGIMIIDNGFNMGNVNNLNFKAFRFWNEFYPKAKNLPNECCSQQSKVGRMDGNNINFVVLFFIVILNM